jgi:hypothetical protein
VAGAQPTGFVALSVDSLPADIYLDAVTVNVSDTPYVITAPPGKHFVSLFPARKVYQAASDQAPDQFWETLRRVGAIGTEPGLLASYEAGSVKSGTAWFYATPGETLAIRLSKEAARRTYVRDSGGAATTFLGWTLAIGAAMVLSVILGSISN